MGIIKMVLYEGFKTARAKSVAAAKASATNPIPKSSSMKEMGKAAVTRSDFDQLASKMESVRNDVHKGMQDLFSQTQLNDHHLFDSMMKLTGAVNQQHETITQILNILRSMGMWQ